MRGGDVKDGEYVYTIHDHNYNAITNIAYSRLDTAKEALRAYYQRFPYAGDSFQELRNQTFSQVNDAYRRTRGPDSLKYAKVKAAHFFVGDDNVYIRRWTITEAVPEAMKPEQKAALNDLGKQKAIPDELQKMIGDYANLERRV